MIRRCGAQLSEDAVNSKGEREQIWSLDFNISRFRRQSSFIKFIIMVLCQDR